MGNGPPTGVPRGWPWATFALAAALVVSWAILGCAVFDGAVSLTYCRAEPEPES